MRNLKDSIRECFDEYKYFWENEVYYSSLRNLGEILDALPILPPEEKKQWMERLHRIEIPEDIIHKAELRMKVALDHILRLLSLPRTLIYENIVFILSKRTEIESIKGFLREIKFYDIDIDLTEVDEKIGHASQRKEVIKDFNSAVRSIRKNSRLPVNNKWL